MKNRAEKDIVSQTRALYEELSGKVRREAERDRQAARRKGPVEKTLLAACFIAVMLAAATLIYGIINFPDAPIRQTASGYVGKHGQPHAREDYERFKLWQKLVAAGFGAAFLAGFGAVAAEKVSRRGSAE